MVTAGETRSEIERKLMFARSLVPDSRFVGPREPARLLDQTLPQWQSWERRLWKTGEEIRQLLVQAPALRRDDALGRQFLELALDRRGGLGRQSFLMLLGFRSFANLARGLISELDDGDVCGHAVWALFRAKVRGASGAVRPLCKHEKAWIRKEACRYLEWDGV
jgi:hypothetical protein